MKVGTLEKADVEADTVTDLSEHPFQGSNHYQVPLRIKTILVPIDFSPTAIRALYYTVALARNLNAHVHLLHVESPNAPPTRPAVAIREFADSVQSLDKRRAEGGDDALPQFWLENCHVRRGRPNEEIWHVAHALKVDLIVLTWADSTQLGHGSYGDATESIAGVSPCPVLIFRERRHNDLCPSEPFAGSGESGIKTVLAPVDFSPCSIGGAIYSAFLAKAFAAKLRLFHVARERATGLTHRTNAAASHGRAIEGSDRWQMQALTRRILSRDVKSTSEVRMGSAGPEICRESRCDPLDLIVMATHGRRGSHCKPLGRVTRYVMRHAHCPVMIVPCRC